MKLEKNSVFLLQGDSITDFYRTEPPINAQWHLLGRGYPQYVEALLDSRYPERHIRVINRGVSGDTSKTLKARWQADTFEPRPDWVSILIGINDVWRQFDLPMEPELHVSPADYRRNLEELIETTLPKVKGLVLMAPFYMEPNRDDAMRRMTEQYAAIVRELAQKYQTVFVGLQAEFDRYFQFYNTNAMSWDRVHPNHVGAMIIARALLDAIVLAVVSTEEEGTYGYYLRLELSAEYGTIYYTLDGTTPTDESTHYTEPIELQEEGETLLSAVAINQKGIVSEPLVLVYNLDFPEN